MAIKYKPTVKELEKKFEETAFRLSQERNDFLLPQIEDFVSHKKWLNLRPEYQRRLVWDTGKRSRFIESLLLNIPIPPVFLYEWELGRYEVMDGQQRLNAVMDFRANGFALKGLERWKELTGYRYNDLPETLQRGLDRRRLSATILLVERPKDKQAQHNDIRKLVFDRLNTGGQQLNAQELRNCLYDGAFNKLLIELSKYPKFQRAWDIPLYGDHTDSAGHVKEPLASDRLYRRMQDCEIILRFFAFRRPGKIRGSVSSMLDKCMEDYLELQPSEINTLREEFQDRLSFAIQVFGKHAFRYQDEKGEWRLSQPLYDAVIVAIDRLWLQKDNFLKHKDKIQKSLSNLLKNEDAYAVIVGRPNTAQAIEDRIKLVQSILAAYK